MTAVLQFYLTWIGPFVRYAILALAILGLWQGLRRAGLTPRARLTGMVATLLLLAWYATVDQLGRAGVYASQWSVLQPLCWAVAVAWLIPLARSPSFIAALDAIPSWFLIGLQSYRALGGFVLVVGWATGRLPSAFALVAGIEDAMVGVFAVVLALCAYAGVRGWRLAAIVWNVAGILDIAGTIVRGSLVPYALAYPALMITAFVAPLSLLLHGLSLWQLGRAMRRERGRAPALAH